MMAKKITEHCCELCGESCPSRKEETKKVKKTKESNNKEKVKIRFCPRCGNTEVKFVFKIKNLFGIIPRMECQKCKYHGMSFPLIEVEKGKIKDVEKLVLNKPKGNLNK